MYRPPGSARRRKHCSQWCPAARRHVAAPPRAGRRRSQRALVPPQGRCQRAQTTQLLDQVLGFLQVRRDPLLLPGRGETASSPSGRSVRGRPGAAPVRCARPAHAEASASASSSQRTRPTASSTQLPAHHQQPTVQRHQSRERCRRVRQEGGLPHRLEKAGCLASCESAAVGEPPMVSFIARAIRTCASAGQVRTAVQQAAVRERRRRHRDGQGTVGHNRIR